MQTPQLLDQTLNQLAQTLHDTTPTALSDPDQAQQDTLNLLHKIAKILRDLQIAQKDANTNPADTQNTPTCEILQLTQDQAQHRIHQLLQIT